MKRQTLKSMDKKIKILFIILPLAMILGGCSGLDPRNVDVELQTTPPHVKTTSFTQALSDLGLMTEIYGTDMLFIQSNPILDETGTSSSTEGEIPRDITEMMKSSLNSIGGNVVYIPYDPLFIQNNMVTGYSNFTNKLVPNVVLSGGITEFDRGLVTKGDNLDASAGADFSGMPDWFPSDEVSLRYSDSGKYGLARITLDFNLLDFQTMSGLSKMTAVNTMEVHKALGEKELGISIFGPTFGLRGDVKKVQGRHAAVRLLVELSTIQVVGKYLIVPYWRLLGDDAKPDKVIIDAVAKYFHSLSESGRISNLQTWLYLYGHDVDFSGVLDDATIQALQQIDPNFNPADDKPVDLDTFQHVYTHIPLNRQALERRHAITRMITQQNQAAALERSRAMAEAALNEAEKTKMAQTTIMGPKRLTPPSRKGIGSVVSKDALIEVLSELSK